MQKHSLSKLALLVAFALAVMVSVATWCFLATPFGNARASGLDSTASSMSVNAGVAESPVPGGPGFYSLSSFAFSPAYESAPEWHREGPDLFNKNLPFDLPVAAPVSLPNGAAVTKFVLYFWDSSANDLSASLYRVPLDGNPVEKMAETFSEGSPGYGYSESTVINTPVIDQQAYAYYVEVPLPQGSEIRLRGIRIDYGYGVSLPLVSRED